MTIKSNWNPLSTQDWADAIGLVNIPLFGAERKPEIRGEFAVLLDGRRASFGLFSSNDADELIYGERALSWAWSANLRHSLIVNEKANVIVHRRWDAPDRSTKFMMPRTRAEAATLFAEKINGARTFSNDGVIGHMLGAFRQVRANLAPHGMDAVVAIRVFNAFLVGTELVRRGELSADEWRGFRTVGEALSFVGAKDKTAGIERIPQGAGGIEVGGLLGTFLDPDPRTGLMLEPDLLIRHASGVLYQDAHFELEREAQLTFPGMAADPSLRASLQRDARFTQPALARAMVQQAIQGYRANAGTDDLVLLDPACGSGIFLQHALQELSGPTNRPLRLVGFDTSPVSCAIAEFCLRRSALDAAARGMTVRVEITEANALRVAWPLSDMILTNPPFAAWKKMQAEDRKSVYDVLGPLFKGHADKAMAFIWRAVGAIRPGGMLASVVPSPLLETDAGERWRKEVLDLAQMMVIGRFRGYSFFQNAMVEPAFIVMRRRLAADDPPVPVQVLLSAEGAEDDSLRALRRNAPEGEHAPDDSYSVFRNPPAVITSASWMPKSRKAMLLIRRLLDSQTATVGELFAIDQGVLTGRNSAFVLDKAEYLGLPERERLYFLPAVGSPTIRDGRILEEEFVFYPYTSDGSRLRPQLTSLKDVRDAVPTYYDQWLRPQEADLCKREGFGADNWWLLTRERKWPKVPKIVTAYFGDAGSFSFDADGRYVVVQGYVWRWIETPQPEPAQAAGDEEGGGLAFNRSELPWAYVAVLNSSVFETMLAHFCPRVQGGQFNLSERFVSQAFLPDLTDESRVVADDVQELSRIGRGMTAGQPIDPERLDPIVAHVYGVPLSDVREAMKG